MKNTKSKPTLISAPQLQPYAAAPRPPLTFLATPEPRWEDAAGITTSAGTLTALQIWTFKATLLNEAIQELKHLEVFWMGGGKNILIVYARSV